MKIIKFIIYEYYKCKIIKIMIYENYKIYYI
jgi:hypothetical protein